MQSAGAGNLRLARQGKRDARLSPPPAAAILQEFGSSSASLTGKVTGATHFDWRRSRDRTHEPDPGPLEQKFLIGPLSLESLRAHLQ